MRSFPRRLHGAAPAVALAVLVALAASACGGSGAGHGSGVASLNGSSSGDQGSSGSGGANSNQDPQEAAIKFATCMRQHGVDMPDPKVDANGRMQIRISGSAGDQRKIQAAQEACQSLLPKNGGGPGGQPDPAQRDAAVRFAQCMREHGIDVPDPDPNGRLTIKNGSAKGRSASDSPDSAKFQDAQRACQHFLDEAAPTTTSP